MVITYPHSCEFHGLSNMQNSHTQFLPIFLRRMEVFLKPVTFPFITSPSMYESGANCIAYNFTRGCALLKVLYSAKMYYGPTKGSNCSPTLAGWNANRP